MSKEDIELPGGFYICKNQNSLKAVLKDMDIDKNNVEFKVDIEKYPCLIYVKDLSFEMGRVHLYGLHIEKLESIIEALKQFRKDEQNKGETECWKDW